ncbi:MAG: emp24/gp25L/p24 family protein [Gammaproteobacteria bacterium]|nr:emp24/gp25L/p24 family protein [Gammaproteobacteria bacterium]
MPYLASTPNIDGASDIEAIIKTIISVMLWGIGIVGVVMIIVIGFQFMTAKDAEDRQRLKSRALWFAIGTGVVILAATIWQLLQGIFEIQ